MQVSAPQGLAHAEAAVKQRRTLRQHVRLRPITTQPIIITTITTTITTEHPLSVRPQPQHGVQAPDNDEAETS